MALPDDSNPVEWVNYLGRMHDGDLAVLREYDSLYQGTAPLHYLDPEILREVEDRMKPVALGWPMLAVDPLEERLDVLGFAYPESEDIDPDAAPAELVSAIGDANLQRVWQDNDLDEESQMGHLDSLVMKRSYVTVGTNDGDTDSPLVTVESPLEMFALIDPRTRKVRAALRRWTEQDFLVELPQTYATLYLPRMTCWFDRGPQGWRETGRDSHDLGEVLVSPLTNRTRLANRYGASELTDPLISLSHAANKIATDMMVGAEFHAIPLRAVFGLGPDDFVKNGKKQSALQVIMGRLMAVPGTGDGSQVKAHEFSASQLSNFHNTLGQLAKHAAGLIGVDPSVLGMSAGDNPASAEALRAREVRLVKKAERRQKSFGGGWERAMRQVRRIQEGDWDPQARRLETIWRDAATPTRAQAADAAVKLLTVGAITKRQARQDLSYTPMQIRRMEAEDKAESQDADLIGQLTRAAGRGIPEEPPVVAPVEA